MQADTESRKAFELVVDALHDIEDYRVKREAEPLRRARDKLEKALSEDPRYLQAHYYIAMTDDLLGRAKDAAKRLEHVLAAASPPFSEEVHYNLGIAYYHQYSQRFLDKAIVHFQRSFESVQNQNRGLHLLARAGLAQTHAMRINTWYPPIEVDLGQIQRDYDLAEKYRKDVEVALLSRPPIDELTRTEVTWTTLNARAIARMYYSDYFGTDGEKVRLLGEALDALEQAGKISPRNFALHCNTASAHMRLGRIKSNAKARRADPAWDFNKALERLRLVTEDIYPDYGFAYYEMGRTYRLMGEFQKAKEFYLRAREIPEDYRNVSNRRLDREIKLLENLSTEFP